MPHSHVSEIGPLRRETGLAVGVVAVIILFVVIYSSQIGGSMSVQAVNNYQGLRYYGNRSTKEVHEVASRTNNCQLDEITDGVRFVPDTIAEARKNGYDKQCLGDGVGLLTSPNLSPGTAPSC